MPSLDELARVHTALGADDVGWLHALVADWQILADLSFGDLVLWLPGPETTGRWAAAQVRPTTGPTTLSDDVVGTFVPVLDEDPVARVLATGTSLRTVRETVHEHYHPVRRGSRVVAVIARRQMPIAPRAPGTLERTYRDVADELVAMIGAGAFPVPGSRSELADSLRVGDGFLRTDVHGACVFASPNAQSVYRRLGLAGDLVGADLAAVTATLSGHGPRAPGRTGLLAGATLGETEVENADASVLMRVIPLRRDARSSGAVVLLRDVTELRLRERQLVSKDATIREIHHRVKNNLQTVASLLRLQSRRLTSTEASQALDEAVRRVGSIALVHETLSRSFGDDVGFDEVADQLLRSVLEVSGPSGVDRGGPRVRAERVGTFGSIPGELATPLAMVLTELVQNAVQHAFDERGGLVTLAVNRIRDRLRLRVSDNGAGLPAAVTPGDSLGLSIVSTLIESELGGVLRFQTRPGGGTTVVIELALT